MTRKFAKYDFLPCILVFLNHRFNHNNIIDDYLIKVKDTFHEFVTSIIRFILHMQCIYNVTGLPCAELAGANGGYEDGREDIGG